jgi:hypothetical protein
MSVKVKKNYWKDLIAQSLAMAAAYLSPEN